MNNSISKITRYDTTESVLVDLVEKPCSKFMENGFYMYLVRIKVRNGYNLIINKNEQKIFFCYKVGYMQKTDKRSFIERMKEINYEFDCCAGCDSNNLLLIFLCKIKDPSIERNFHKDFAARQFNVPVNKVTNARTTISKECYQICPEFYDIFNDYVVKNLDEKNIWEYIKYVLSDNNF